jgi:hypothetical protein
MREPPQTSRVRAALAARANVRSVNLIDEIERYLEAIALFSALGHEPVWAPETEGSP